MTSIVDCDNGRKCINQAYLQADLDHQFNVSKVKISPAQGQGCQTLQDGNKIKEGPPKLVKRRPPTGQRKKSMTQERGDNLIEMHDRNTKPSSEQFEN